MKCEFSGPSLPVSEQAAEWFFELSDGPADWQARRQFVRWLKRSPQHIDSFLAVAVLEQDLSDRAGGSDEVEALVSGAASEAIPMDGAGAGDRPAEGRKPPPRGYRIGWLAAAAITTVTFLGSLPLLLPGDVPPTFVHKTDFGEQRSIALGDGSIVVLNTLSEVAVHYGEDVRRVELLAGQAFFDVARDPRRPFVVEAGTVALNVLGTRFSVYSTPQSTRLAVIEGVVRAVSQRQPEQEVLVRAGEGAFVTVDGAIRRMEEIDVPKAIAWTERRLIFEDVPLQEVVYEFNRYNRRPLVVQDPELGERRITSVFFANDVSALVAFLELEPDVEVDYGADAIRIHRKR